jgi:predicted nucleic acid-binding protein
MSETKEQPASGARIDLQTAMSKHFLDTSVLVAAMVRSHPQHERALPWLVAGKRRDDDLAVAAHTLAELHAVLTSLPIRPRISPVSAHQLIMENLRDTQWITLDPPDYQVVLKRLADLGLSGGVVYDALIARCAEKCGADKLVTLNPTDFRRVWPEGADRIVSAAS